MGGKGAIASERTLYPHFYSWLEEGAVAEFMARCHKPMPDEDVKHFGLTPFRRCALAAAGN